MSCQNTNCNSTRIVDVQTKCSDRCYLQIGSGPDHDGYVPNDLGIGGGDYLSFEFCLQCGQMQGDFPVASHELEEKSEDDGATHLVLASNGEITRLECGSCHYEWTDKEPLGERTDCPDCGENLKIEDC